MDELLSTPKILTFLLKLLPLLNEKDEHASKIQYHNHYTLIYLLLFTIIFLVNLKAPNKQFPTVNSVLRSNSQCYFIDKIQIYYISMTKSYFILF